MGSLNLQKKSQPFPTIDGSRASTSSLKEPSKVLKINKEITTAAVDIKMKLATCSLLFAGVLLLVLGVESNRLENNLDLVNLLVERRGIGPKAWSNSEYSGYGAIKAFDDKTST